jgi:hypothetical protein
MNSVREPASQLVCVHGGGIHAERWAIYISCRYGEFSIAASAPLWCGGWNSRWRFKNEAFSADRIYLLHLARRNRANFRMLDGVEGQQSIGLL